LNLYSASSLTHQSTSRTVVPSYLEIHQSILIYFCFNSYLAVKQQSPILKSMI